MLRISGGHKPTHFSRGSFRCFKVVCSRCHQRAPDALGKGDSEGQRALSWLWNWLSPVLFGHRKKLHQLKRRTMNRLRRCIGRESRWIDMTISELIERLRDVKSQHGDIPVTVDDENGEHDEITDVR